MDAAHGIEASFSLVGHQLRKLMQERADRTVINALGVALCLEAGFSPTEIETRLTLTKDEYREAHIWARWAIADLARS
jgi:hypothetical protein